MSIDLHIDGAIATVSINNPNELNALDVDHLRELVQTFEELGKRADVRVILLTGEGDRAFVAGANIKRMSVMSRAEARKFGQLGHAVGRVIESTPQPVIAVINGFALGGGCEISLACDMRICSDNALFAQPEVVLGIPPGWGGTQRLPRIVGKGIASEMILTGRRVKADEALRIGLVNAVYEQSALMGEAYRLAKAISKNSPAAVRLSKQLIADINTYGYEEGLIREAEAFADVFESHDQREGMAAFVDKREAVFRDGEESDQ